MQTAYRWNPKVLLQRRYAVELMCSDKVSLLQNMRERNRTGIFPIPLQPNLFQCKCDRPTVHSGRARLQFRLDFYQNPYGSRNKIDETWLGEPGAMCIRMLLERNRVLNSLDLRSFCWELVDYNKFGSSGVEHIAEGLVRNRTLKTLGISMWLDKNL